MAGWRGLAIAWVAVVLAGMGLLNEPIRGMFDGTVSFNWLGFLVIGATSVASIVGAILMVRVRARDGDFRGALSQLTLLVAWAEVAVMGAGWIFYFAEGTRLAAP